MCRTAGPPASSYSPGFLRRRLSRRRLLRAGSATLGLAALGMAGCSPAPPDRRPKPAIRISRDATGLAPVSRWPGGGFSEWARHARLANASFGEDPDEEELVDILNHLRAEKVSVVECDTNLSDWLTDEEFEQSMAVATHFNRLVHGAGLKVVWYYPSMGVITPGGEYGPSFYKTYPEWAQVSIDDEPNVFYGSVVFWVEPGAESVWLSPNGPWREYYRNRVKKIALTGADSIWPDVPLYASFTVDWCDQSVYARDAFKVDTGLDLPKEEDWNDPVWRRWIEWR